MFSRVRAAAMVGVLCVLCVGVTRASRRNNDDTRQFNEARLAAAVRGAGFQDHVERTDRTEAEFYGIDFEEDFDEGMGPEEEEVIEVKGKFPANSKLRMRDTPKPKPPASKTPPAPAPRRPAPQAATPTLSDRLLSMFSFRLPRIAVSRRPGRSLPSQHGSALPARVAYAGAQARAPEVDQPGRCFNLVTQSMLPTRARVSLTILPTALPGTGSLELVTPKGKVVSAPVVRVIGTWRFDVTADNGWRVQLTPKPVDARPKTLTYTADFFKDNESKPFETRTGTLSLSEDRCGTVDPSLTFSLAEIPRQDECTALYSRMAEVGKRINAGETKAFDELQALQDTIQECTLKQIIDQQALLEKLMDPVAQKELDSAQDNFGCNSLALTPGAEEGSVTGMLYCGRNVKYPRVTGTMAYVRAK